MHEGRRIVTKFRGDYQFGDAAHRRAGGLGKALTPMSENNEKGTPVEPGGEELLTREEVARRLRVHPSTVDNWRKRYGLPTIEKGNKVYFDWPDVKAWLKSGPMKAGRRKKVARSSSGKRSGEAGGKELELAMCGGAAAERRAEA